MKLVVERECFGFFLFFVCHLFAITKASVLMEWINVFGIKFVHLQNSSVRALRFLLPIGLNPFVFTVKCLQLQLFFCCLFSFSCVETETNHDTVAVAAAGISLFIYDREFHFKNHHLTCHKPDTRIKFIKYKYFSNPPFKLGLDQLGEDGDGRPGPKASPVHSLKEIQFSAVKDPI